MNPLISSLLSMAVFLLSIFGVVSAAPQSIPTPVPTAIDNTVGASGGSDSSWQVSGAAIGALCVVVGLVTMFGIITSLLFVIAKKNQLSMRQSIARTSRRVVAAMTPTTTTAFRFPSTHAPPSEITDYPHRCHHRQEPSHSSRSSRSSIFSTSTSTSTSKPDAQSPPPYSTLPSPQQIQRQYQDLKGSPAAAKTGRARTISSPLSLGAIRKSHLASKKGLGKKKALRSTAPANFAASAAAPPAFVFEDDGGLFDGGSDKELWIDTDCAQEYHEVQRRKREEEEAMQEMQRRRETEEDRQRRSRGADVEKGRFGEPVIWIVDDDNDDDDGKRREGENGGRRHRSEGPGFGGKFMGFFNK